MMALTEAVIDVSEHQGDIDFAVCYAAGIRNAIPRAGIGGRYDFKLDRNVDGFRSVGIAVPALYWFINPKSSVIPEQQGDLAEGACFKYGVKTMMLDCEWYTDEGGPNPPIAGFDYNQWCLRFISRLGDVRPIIYTSASFWDSWGGAGSDFGSMDTIIASYKWQNRKGQNDPIAQGVPPDRWGEVVSAKSTPPLPIGWDTTIEGWQFSAGFNHQGPVYGMRSGDLDLNVVDRDALARWLGTTPPPPPPPPQTQGEDMRWFVANTEEFPAFDDQDGVHWTGPNPDGSFPRGYLVFEMLPGGKRHVQGSEWWALWNSSLGQGVFAPGPTQIGQLSWESTGWIQTIPNVPRPSASVTVDGESIAQRTRQVFAENPLK